MERRATPLKVKPNTSASARRRGQLTNMIKNTKTETKIQLLVGTTAVTTEIRYKSKVRQS